MAKLSLVGGTTSKTVKLFAQSSTTGLAATGLAFNTSGLTCYYIREGASSSTVVNLVTATLGTWTSSGFIVADGTNMQGLYEFGIPNAALASGAASVIIMFQGTGIVISPIEIELTSTNNQDYSSTYGGAVWLDTTNGTSGTANGINGLQDKPSDTIAHATTIAGSIGIKRFQMLPESSITLAQTYRDYYFGGENWTVALGSQDISGCTFFNAIVSGIAAAANAGPTFNQCVIGTATLPPAVDVFNSFISGTITTASGGGNFNFLGCASSGTAVFDLGASHSATTVRLRDWKGAITVKHLFAGDTFAVDGYGQVTIDTTCTGGTIGIHGTMDLVNNGTGVTISQVARISSDSAAGPYPVNVTQINAVSASSVTTIDAVLGTTSSNTPQSGDAYSQLNTLIPHAFVYDANNIPKADVADWGGTAVNGTVPPDTIFIRNGTAQAGGASTITLDAGASATNNIYTNEIIFIRSGTGAGQSNIIASYVGSTKVATVSNAWATNPDNTSVFSILALGPVIASVSGTVTANVTQWLGSAVTAASAGIPDINVKNIGGSASVGAAGYAALDWSQIHAPTTAQGLTGTTISSTQAVASVSGAVGSISGVTFPSNFGSLSISVAGKINEVVLVDTLTTYTGNTPQTGDAYAVVTSGTFGNSALHTQIAALLTTAVTEAYAANGSPPTVAQLLLMIYSALQNFSIGGTTLTLLKLDGATSWGTVTLNDATNPTSRVRAT